MPGSGGGSGGGRRQSNGLRESKSPRTNSLSMEEISDRKFAGNDGARKASGGGGAAAAATSPALVSPADMVMGKISRLNRKVEKRQSKQDLLEDAPLLYSSSVERWKESAQILSEER